jgi:hypothetical protein
MLALILIFKFPSSLGWRYQYGFAIAEIMDRSDGWQCVSVLVQMQQCNSYWLLASTIETQQIIPWDPGGETHFIDLDKNLSVSTLVHLWQLLSLFLDFAFSAELQFSWFVNLLLSPIYALEWPKLPNYTSVIHWRDITIVSASSVWEVQPFHPFTPAVHIVALDCIWDMQFLFMAISFGLWKLSARDHDICDGGQLSLLISCSSYEYVLSSSINILELPEILGTDSAIPVTLGGLLDGVMGLIKASTKFYLDIAMVPKKCSGQFLYFQEDISGFHANEAMSLTKITTKIYLQAPWDPG